ncbi:phenylalanine--tRNA ligase subunit beta [Paenibacillus albiflavus]|uniref:Phenylalanine--tRNA ligase beta subunit n=1 Tax=Paenibacillus albiflavus TaxID=2545760 RepID=A0A4R4E6D8_9BACL|nr:phenylalanine--tRNA ligase subunit beta [Paenibacillus albiflavus]TCZ74617.1 phenylalanine--tRNA ligase subunit beta [Paenibacillus albiflavus]
MKVSYQWLSQYVDVSGYTGEDLAEKLTRSGIEVDIVENRNNGVSDVVVGYVKMKEKHPDADKLNVCIVDVGQEEDLQIVCGAPNVAAGQKVPVAVIGAVLPGDFKIKRAKLRGVESQGMICSAKELGMNDKLLPKEIQEGILVLPEDTEIGTSILDVLALNDKVLDLDLTPNRSDALSMIGVAYEIAAILGREIKLPNPECDLASMMTSEEVQTSDRIGVTIAENELCTHYSIRLIEGVEVTSSPLWMQNRLMAAGIRPINNIVDITNYVMLEYGQPLHAFDADKLADDRIEVRLAEAGEKLVTLDDVERELEPHMLVIADGEKPIALAGVMGGANSEVTSSTTRIALESAKFAGKSVRKTSRQLGLRSEASLRFEKEVDPARVIAALNRAAVLMSEYAHGKIAKGIAETHISDPAPVSIELSLARVNGYLGMELTQEQVKSIMGRLYFEYEELSDSSLLVHVPSRRGDITLDVDLIEEVARLHGYDHIPATLISGETTPGSLTREQAIRRMIRNIMTQSGLHEVLGYSLVRADQSEMLPSMYPQAKPIGLAMPMSEDRSVLRTSLVPNMIETAIYNRNRKNENLALFEMGKVFITEETTLTKQPEEKMLLSALIAGKRLGEHWSYKSVDNVDFYDLKGVFERVLSYFGIQNITFEQAAPAGFHPGRTAEIVLKQAEGRRVIGRMGQLHPALQKQQDLDDTYVLEVELEPIIAEANDLIVYKILPRYPSVTRDLALVVDSAVPVGQMEQVIHESAGKLLESLHVFDIYSGDKLGGNKKSVAFSLVYRAAERTLQDEEIAEVQEKVLNALQQTFSAELRK